MDREQITTKVAALESEEREFQDMMRMFAGLSDEQLTAPALDNGWTIKDDLAHNGYWLEYVISMIETDGQTALATNADMDAINEQVYQQRKEQPLAAVQTNLHQARARLLDLVAALPDAALTDPAYYPWRNGRPLLNSLVGNTSDHYREHMTLLAPYVNQIKPQKEI